MSGIFSFIKHPIVGVLEKSSLLIPGLEKAVALYFNENTNTLQCESLNTNSELIDYFIADTEGAQKLRDRKITFQWMSSQNLPFETNQIDKKQFNIFDELDNVVLCIGFFNATDKKTDLIFLYLNHNKGNFGISNSNKNISTSEKSIIGNMVYNTLSVFLKQQQADSETLKLVNSKVKLLQIENEQLNKKLNNVTENYLASIIEMCKIHLKTISNKYGVQFDFAPDAIDKLQYFNGNIDELKSSLTDSALLALNMNFGQNEGKILLKAWDINFTKQTQSVENETYLEVNDRYQKTLQLLNKLENAARKVVNKNQRLTSENVGYACPTPISAPAISDALKNHQKKLTSLMTNHPEKWPTIRNEFRPIKNILNNASAG